jgi:hypothetical protein
MKVLGRLTWVLLFMLNGDFSYPQIGARWSCFNGQIHLLNGDSLTGVVFLYETTSDHVLVTNDYLGFHPSIEYLSLLIDTNNWKKNGFQIYTEVAESDTSIKWVRNRNVKRVKIFLDEGKCWIEYKNLYDNDILWKLLKGNDSAAIYNDLILPIEIYLGAARNMVLVTKNEKVIIHSFWGWLFSNSRVDKLLVQFINRRYKKSFNLKDFNSIDEMFDYIFMNR